MTFFGKLWQLLRHPRETFREIERNRGRKLAHELMPMLSHDEWFAIVQSRMTNSPKSFDIGFLLGCCEYRCMTEDTSITLNIMGPQPCVITCNSYGEWE